MTHKKQSFYYKAMVYCTLFLVLFPLSAKAEPVAVIVNAANPISEISLEDIRNFYENIVLTWKNGTIIKLYNLRTNNPTRHLFSLAVLKKEPKKVAFEWGRRKIKNMAKNPPKTLKSSILVLDRVAKNPAAIGYIPVSMVKGDRIKVISTIK